MRKIFPLLGWLIAIALVISGAVYFSQMKNDPLVPQVITLNPESYDFHKFEAELLSKIQPVANPISEDQVKVSGWMPDWDYTDAKATVKKLGENLHSVHPFWYEALEDGSLKSLAKAGEAEISTMGKSSGFKVIPTVACFDYELLSKILRDPVKLQNHIKKIVDLVITNDYDGIDLNYESIRLADKQSFYKLVSEVSTQIREKGKLFSITVLAKWGDVVLYQGLPQTREIFDYAELQKYADKFNIMSYDYLGRDPAWAGPMAPIAWQEKIIKYAIAKGVPREKIFLGLHTYAYDWSDRPVMTDKDIDNFDEIGGIFVEGKTENARAYYYNDVEVVKQRYNLQANFKESWGEFVGEYTLNGKRRVVVYIGNEGIVARKKLAAKYGIGGLVYWRFGDEGGLKL